MIKRLQLLPILCLAMLTISVHAASVAIPAEEAYNHDFHNEEQQLYSESGNIVASLVCTADRFKIVLTSKALLSGRAKVLGEWEDAVFYPQNYISKKRRTFLVKASPEAREHKQGDPLPKVSDIEVLDDEVEFLISSFIPQLPFTGFTKKHPGKKLFSLALRHYSNQLMAQSGKISSEEMQAYKIILTHMIWVADENDGKIGTTLDKLLFLLLKAGVRKYHTSLY